MRKGIEAVGDLSEARKIGKYAEIATNIDREFLPIVLYIPMEDSTGVRYPL